MGIINGIQKFLHTLRTTKNVEVGQDLVVDGDGTIDGGLTITGGNITFQSVGSRLLGSNAASGYVIPHSFYQTSGGMALLTGTNNNILISEVRNRMFDFGHAAAPTPTPIGHSDRQSQVEYWSKTHNRDNVIYGVGKGGHTFTTAAQKARGTMTVAGIPVADETFVINATTITFKADGSGDIDHCTIAGSAAAQVTNIVTTLGECTEAANLTAWDGAGDTVVVEWGTAGVAGNAIVFTEAATNVTVDGAGTLGATHAGIAAATLFTIGEDKAIAVPGVLTVTGSAILNNGVVLASNREVAASAATHGSFVGRSTFQTIDAPFLTTGTVANHLIFCENADWIFNFEHTQQTNPTFYLHSANQATNEWISLTHDQADAVIGSGLGAVTLANGVLRFLETTTPGARANYGAIYTKEDNLLYFQDGDGNEHILSEANTNLAEMYLNNNGNPTTIDTAGTPIMIRNYTTGELNDWTYNAGSTGAITAYADGGGGLITVTSAGHGLASGDIISIRGTTAPNDYNGLYEITYVGVNSFTIVKAFNADAGASDWDEGDYLLAGTGSAGKYEAAWSLSASPGGAGVTVDFGLVLNAAVRVKATVHRKFANNDIGAMGSQEIMTIAVGDRIAMYVQSDGVAAVTCSYGNLSLNQL